MNGSDALLVLGEVRSDIKWLVKDAAEKGETLKQYHQRLSQLEEKPAKREVPWPLILRYGAGLLPLLAALAHRIPWAKAFDIFHGLLG